MRTRLLILLLFCINAAAHAEQFTGKVIAVLDGDTVMVVRSSGPPVKVRLAGIDAPEVGHAGMGGKPPNSQKAQPGGTASKESLSELVLHKQVSVDTQATDTYGRLVAHLAVNGKSINEEQVRRGMAWGYPNYSSNKSYIALQSEAQQAKRGLWAGDEIMVPTQWRKLHPSSLSDGIISAGTPRIVPQNDPALQPGSGQACSKKYCSEMASCAEAMHYLTVCGVKTLDSDGDGTPCERLCSPPQKTKN